VQGSVGAAHDHAPCRGRERQISSVTSQRMGCILGSWSEISGVPPPSDGQFSVGVNRLRAFVGAHCGLVSNSARCHCTQQLRGLPDASVRWLQTQPLSGGQPAPLLHDRTARQGVQDIKRLQTAAQVFKAHPAQAASPELAQRVREQLAQTVFDGQVPKTPPA
jgi:hypothetical protein